MGALVLSAVFLLTVAIGAVLAKGILSLVLHLIVDERVPAAGSFKIAGILVAVIAVWSLAPAIVESPAAAGLLALVR